MGTARLRCSFGPAGLAVLGLAAAGCDSLPYVLHLAQGQLAVQGQVEPIADVLASGRLSAEEQARLELVVRARQFAVDTMGLAAGRSYTTFYDTAGDPLAWNLSAARRDRLVPKTWTFPLVGEVPYLAFFDEGYLRTVEAQLVAEGYDTLAYELDAYSTLGVFEDPVRSTMLRRDPLSLVETILHELLHNTVWRPGATVFNESLATFVGRRGAVEFLQREYGPDSDWPRIAAAYYADLDRVNAFLLELYAALEDYYARPATPEQRIAGREAVYQAARTRFVEQVRPHLNYPEVFESYARLPTNNAWVLAHYRYNLDLELMADVFAAVGEDWPAALEVFRAAAAAPGDPFAWLRTFLEAR